MKLTEDKLSSAIRAGNIDKLYFLYGKEPFLINMHTDRIIKKTVGEDALDFNLQRLDGNPEPDVLSDYIESLPVFAERKVITVKDYDPEKNDADTDKRILDMISDIPDTTILIFYCTGIAIDEKKAKTKKFIAAVEKNGTVCATELMKAPKIAELCVKKAAKGGVVLSYDDALELTERVGGSMASASDETAKLMSYAGSGGTITRENINALVPKRLEAEVFDLAAAINSGRRADAFRIIDELFSQQISPVNILSALSGAYLDMYCAKLAKVNGISPQNAAQMFGFYGGRQWGFANKVYPAAARLGIGYLRETVSLMSETDIKLKSSAVDKRILIEKAVTKLFIFREQRPQ